MLSERILAVAAKQRQIEHAHVVQYLGLLAAIDGHHLALALDVDCRVHAPVDVHLRFVQHP